MNTCTKTIDIGLTETTSDPYTWWYVNLGDVHSVYNIRIQFKDYGPEYSKRLSYQLFIIHYLWNMRFEKFIHSFALTSIHKHPQRTIIQALS